MKSSQREIQQIISTIIPQITNLKPKLGNIPIEWNEIQAELLSIISKDSSIANDSEIICALALFANKLTDSNAVKFLNRCNSIGIGLSHTLWFSLIALGYEKMKNYIESLFTFEQAKKNNAQPEAFLDLKYNDFKGRMKKRFQLNDKLELGSHNNIFYLFQNGMIVAKANNGMDCNPEFDILKIIGYTANQSSFASINMSNNTSKQDHYTPGYLASLLIGSDEKECSFEEQRLASLGYDYLANRRINPNILMADDNQQEEVILPKKKRNPLQPISVSRVKVEPLDGSFSFNGLSAQPKSILKKHDQTSVPSPRNASKSISGVTFDHSVFQQSPDRRRPPTPVPKRQILVNEMINTSVGILSIEQQIGEHSYLGRNQNGDYVIKISHLSSVNFQPQHPKFFSMSISESVDFYITPFYNNGSLEKVINMYNGKKPDQLVSLYYLLNMIIILQDLEDNNCSHDEINPKNLLLRTSSEELSKKFGVNEVGWSDTGLTLIRCDKLSSMKSNQEKSNDRLSVYNIFYILSTGNSYSGTFEQCPKRWNNNIWQLTYDILTSNKAFDPLIAMIMKELEQNALSLRCKIARVACQD